MIIQGDKKKSDKISNWYIIVELKMGGGLYKHMSANVLIYLGQLSVTHIMNL